MYDAMRAHIIAGEVLTTAGCCQVKIMKVRL